MTPLQLLLILWARRWLILIVFAGAALAGMLMTYLQPKLYMASTSIVADFKPDPLLGALAPNAASSNYMATQTEIIQSDRVAIRVVKQLGLEKNPVFVEQWRNETAGKIPFDNYFGSFFKRGLMISPSHGSSIIQLNYVGQDPAFVAAVANTYAQAYIDVSIDMRVDPARQYAVWYDERLKTLRANLVAAQEKLSAYQKENEVVVTGNSLDQETDRLSSLNEQLARVQGDRAADIARAEAKLDELGTTLGKNHPSYQQLEAQIASLKSSVSKEARWLSRGRADAPSASAPKEQELRQLIDAQKKRVLEMRDEYDQISVLTKDVQVAQQSYDAVAQRLSQVTLESKSELTNLSILSPALPPTEIYSPKISKFLLVSFGGAFVLSIALALALEFLDRRVRAPADLLHLEGVAFLGVLQEESVGEGLRRRLLGLWRRVCGWRGVRWRRALKKEPR